MSQLLYFKIPIIQMHCDLAWRVAKEVLVSCVDRSVSFHVPLLCVFLGEGLFIVSVCRPFCLPIKVCKSALLLLYGTLSTIFLLPEKFSGKYVGSDAALQPYVT